MTAPRLLAGPDPMHGPERFRDHVSRLGPLPRGGHALIETLVRTGITGRGGADFPVGLKWRTVASARQGSAVVIVNGAEGEPHSKKDRHLMTSRPHLILDGAVLAAASVRAKQIVLYIGEAHHASLRSMSEAVAQRPENERQLMRIVRAPGRYVAGDSSATVHLVETGIATPTTTPPPTRERGVDGAPTLVQNVETLAQVALVARTGVATGTLLITVAGAVRAPGVFEVNSGTPLGEAVQLAGGGSSPTRAVLLGGYFGQWVEADTAAAALPIDPHELRARGLSLGCGVIGLLPASTCPVCEVAGIMRYLASESSAQCGPCFFGLRALADACTRIAERGTDPGDLQRLQRWSAEVHGRGACKHPDGAVMFLRSAMKTFEDDFARHPAHQRRSA
ncbi:MAG TPA: NADH-ubiquinone oxidoreductase-F iron-sulfur binding region domain-containing protein [Candidatus Acidoferrum sp.]|nr:NADH-ubiquinone oxidoreductase-F iron-sulfur binding region domain-containing protein [Candidatus Acidoferrum sp.]